MNRLRAHYAPVCSKREAGLLTGAVMRRTSTRWSASHASGPTFFGATPPEDPLVQLLQPVKFPNPPLWRLAAGGERIHRPVEPVCSFPKSEIETAAGFRQPGSATQPGQFEVDRVQGDAGTGQPLGDPPGHGCFWSRAAAIPNLVSYPSGGGIAAQGHGHGDLGQRPSRQRYLCLSGGRPDIDSPQGQSQQSSPHKELDCEDHIFGEGHPARCVRIRSARNFGFADADFACVRRVRGFSGAHFMKSPVSVRGVRITSLTRHAPSTGNPRGYPEKGAGFLGDCDGRGASALRLRKAMGWRPGIFNGRYLPSGIRTGSLKRNKGKERGAASELPCTVDSWITAIRQN